MKTEATGQVYLAAALSMTAALIHVWAMPEHFSEWWAYGAFFLLVALAQGLFGVSLLRWPRKLLFGAGIAGNLSIVSLYIVTRMVGVPFFGPHAWHPEGVGALDLAATAAELLLVVALVALAKGFAAARVYLVNLWRPRAATALAGALAAVAMLAAPAVGGLNVPGLQLLPLRNAQAQSAPAACNAASYDRSYDVAAINVEIPYNRFSRLGPPDPTTGERPAENLNEHGQVFALEGDKKAVDNWHMQLGATPAEDPAGADNRRLRPRPLVIRANAGECVKVKLTNELDAEGHDGLPNDPRVSMHINGVAYNAQTSDGSMVGNNLDTTVGIGETKHYYWKAPREEGLYFFRDDGATAGSEADGGSTSHGLYGALAVEPAGSKWLDPETGKPLYAGTTNHDSITKQSGDPYIDADIVPAVGKAFRETVQISQDEIPGGIGMGFNYGSEPQHNREGNPVPDGLGEETSLSSWTYGDPALIKLASGFGPWLPEKDAAGNPVTDTDKVEDCGLPTSCYVSDVTHTYKGDPTKIRFAHAGPKETHVFHLHAHQWRIEPNDPGSQIIDSQTYGPGESFTADLLFGSGSQPGTIGDSIFHCHLYPHFADGFWALLRTHDVLEDGTNTTPDGINVRSLKPLPDQTALPAADLNFDAQGTDNPGYPRYIPGKFGWRAPQPIGGISEPSGVADDAATVKREDLKPATRVVAGKPLDGTLNTADPVEKDLADKLAVEQKVLAQAKAGGAGKPGAPFTDPCPTGAREVTYNVSVMQRDVVYNEDGWHDTQARFLVLDKDVPRMLEKNPNGTYKYQPEPLFFRANAGDCINFNFTNRLPNWYGNDAFQEAIQTNMAAQHIHLVKFDVTASDGSSNGWNYQQAAFTQDQMNFSKDVLGGKQACDATSGCRIESPPAGFDFNRGTTPTTVGQTIHERWYADSELNTVFSHDHHFAAVDQNRGWYSGLVIEPKGMDFRNPTTGQYYQPGNGSIAGAPTCGVRCEGTAVGTAMDIIGPGAKDDFREYGLGLQDFALLHKSAADGGAPINPPAAPEHFPDADPGVMGINLRNAPFKLRQTDDTGQPTDPAHVFSSYIHGDPQTPLLEAYTNDPIRLRLIQGSQEEQHVFSINGMNWRKEPNDPNSPLVNSQTIGISEAFNFQAPAIDCAIAQPVRCYADLLYGGQATDDMYLGMWGIMRVRGEKASLLPLPDNPVADKIKGDSVPKKTPGQRPFSASNPGQPCPPGGAPRRNYQVVAMQADLKYNKYGDHDPYGLIYALSRPDEKPEQTVARVRAQGRYEPLVLRANEGDCVQVNLTNMLTNEWLGRHPNAGTDGDPTLPLEDPTVGTPAGLRVSLHPQLVTYDPRGSDGTAVGFNPDQTVGPGESKMYRWYVDNTNPGELGATNLLDFGDVRGHRHHGLFAGLNIEPAGSTYHDPFTGAQISGGASADIHVPGAGNDFREFTTFFQNGLNLRDKTGVIIEDPLDHPPTPEEPAGEPMDAEDQGEKGFNYANAPFRNRLGFEPITAAGMAQNPLIGTDLAHVFSSTDYGDPDTPIFKAFAGDRIRMRVLQGSDKPRQNSFQLSGSNWKAQPNDPRSNLIGTQGGFSVARAENVHLNDGTGGEGALYPGDYRYGNGVLFHHLSAGQWGIMRVLPPADGSIQPLEP